MINIFIANLDWEVTSDDLHQTFSTFGTVTYAHVVYDKHTKRSMGFGYVEMEDSDQGINAIQALNGLEVNGRPIDVKVASPKANRAPKKPAAAPKPKPVYKTDGRNNNGASNRPRRPRRDNN